MRRTLIALPLVCLCLLFVQAQEAPPTLPKAAKGFDDGRAKIVREAADNPFGPDGLVARLFEEADLAELADFCFAHLRADEKNRLDGQLKLNGALAKAVDPGALEAVLRGAKLTPAAVTDALGTGLVAQGVKLSDAVAWLYVRGFNFHVLQRAMNGERIDSIRLRRQLREAAAKGNGPDVLFAAAHWDFNLLDGREEMGGHYDAQQLCESLLALGWTEEQFGAALARLFPKGLNETQRALIRWGDAHLLWKSVATGVAESELIQLVLEYLRTQQKAGVANPRVMLTSLARGRVLDRWFRTGGANVVGVWTGPLPASNGEPKPPTLDPSLQKADAEAFAKGLTPAIKAHFADAKADTLTIVAYTDGSARMIVNRPGRAPARYGPATPPATTSKQQMYEGRFSLDGRIGYATLVFGEGLTLAPPEIDLANVRLVADGALMTADLDDGVTLAPMLLRRASRLIDAP